MSGIYDLTLANGASGNIPALGNYAKVYSAPLGSVQLRIDGGEAYSLMEGQGIRLPDAKLFRDVTIKNTSGSTQTVLIFVGDSRFEDTRITGSVRVIDEITDALTYNEQNFALASTFGAAQVYTFVAAASNVRGMILRGYGISVTNGAGGVAVIQLCAAKSAPTNYLLPTQRYLIGAVGQSGAAAVNSGRSDARMNKLLPTGWGLYAVWSIDLAAAVTMNCNTNYELL